MKMNVTSVGFEVPPTSRGIITDEDYVIIDYALAYVIFFFSLIGVVTNSINIKTFVSMGLEDGITVSLMGLALSDLGFTFFSAILGMSNILSYIEATHNLKNLPIAPKFVFVLFSANIGLMFYLVTCIITTYVAVARCMCVAMPFRFKDFFTKSRSIFALVVFNAMAVSVYLPLLSQMGMQRKFDPMVNTTRIVLWMSNKRSDFKDVISFLHFVVFLFLSTFVVAVCILVMAKHLRQSVQFRHAMSVKGTEPGRDGKNAAASKLSGKELQVVQQVIIICTIYALSTVPTLFYAFYRLAEADFDVGKRLHNFYLTISPVTTVTELINSATTFPVYYAYNSKFRSHCFSLGLRTAKPT